MLSPGGARSNGIVERFNATVRDESNKDYGDNYLQAEAIIARLMHHYNEERLHAALGYMTRDRDTWGGSSSSREQLPAKVRLALEHEPARGKRLRRHASRIE